jgi:methionine-gamma-lyase
MKHNDPATAIQDILNFGEFGGVNPSITDSSTYTFLAADRMEEIFDHEIEGCYLYSRHWNPSNRYLADALAIMEGTESAQVTGSGMAAISNVMMQICSAGDHLIAGKTMYGGTYALLNNYLPRFGVETTLVDITNPDEIKSSIRPNTKMIYCEAMSNPLLEIADIPELSKLCIENNLKLVVDNTFTPLIISPYKLGADIVIHSLTKFINGSSDTVAGAICADKEFIDSLMDVNSGTTMLLGPVMDSMRSASVLKNLHNLHLRMRQHSRNALTIAGGLKKLGIRVRYCGLQEHPQYELMTDMMNDNFGYGGMVLLDLGTKKDAYDFMERLQKRKVGYLAVSLGFYKTLFSAPGSSTSSEVPEDQQDAMGMSEGLVRMSVGLDNDIERSFKIMVEELDAMGKLHTHTT